MSSRSKWPPTPAFLSGTCGYGGCAYAFASAPPADLLDAARLCDPDYWLRLASVLAHAKRGDHTHVALLRGEAMNPDGEPVLGGGCLDVLVDAGSRADLEFLAERMLDEQVADTMRGAICAAARCAGEAWLIEWMIACHRSIARLVDREAVAVWVSSLLEPEAGPRDLLGDPHDADLFERVARAKLHALLDELGTDQAVVLHGRKFDVQDAVTRLRSALMQQTRVPWLLRRKFEVYTGARLQRLRARRCAAPSRHSPRDGRVRRATADERRCVRGRTSLLLRSPRAALALRPHGQTGHRMRC